MNYPQFSSATVGNITIDDIYDYVDNLVAFDNANESKIVNSERKQLEQEQLLLDSVQTCPQKDLARISSKVEFVKENLLQREINNRFYSPATMNTATCVTDSVFYSAGGSINGMIKLKKFITNLKATSTPSAEGVAVFAGFGNADNMFTLKSPKKAENKKANDEIAHELIVALYGTNRLRREIPNFAYIYGGFKCSSPIVDPDSKRVLSWCVGSGDVQYVIYENIYPSDSWRKYIETATPKQFLSAYLQVLYALRLARQRIDFTHYDLHDDNVLMRKYVPAGNDQFQIVYETENGTEYLTTDRVATFIDYGFSHINYKGNNFGLHNELPNSVFPDRAHPFFDAYKLLMFSLFRLNRENINNKLIPTLETIYRYFDSDGDALEMSELGFDDEEPALRYQLPYEPFAELDLYDLCKYIRRNCDCSFINKEPTSDKILACENSCPNPKAVYREIGLDQKFYSVDNFYDYYDLVHITGSYPDMNYDGALDAFIQQIMAEKAELDAEIERIYQNDMMNTNATFFVYTLVNLLDRYYTYNLSIDVGVEVMAMFNDDINLSDFYSLDPDYEDLVNKANDLPTLDENAEKAITRINDIWNIILPEE